MQLYLKQCEPEERLLLAGDHTAWSRIWAETLAERGYQHAPSAIAGQRPVTIGQSYSTLAIIPEAHRSWALPLLHERITNQKPIETAAQQLQQVCQKLAVRPLSLWDSEYGTAVFLRATAEVSACAWKDPLSRVNPKDRRPSMGSSSTSEIPARGGPPTNSWNTPIQSLVP